MYMFCSSLEALCSQAETRFFFVLSVFGGHLWNLGIRIFTRILCFSGVRGKGAVFCSYH